MNASAYSNESIKAKALIDQASSDMQDMISKQIPVSRANESLQEAIQIYAAQLALEDTKGNADYKLVEDYASTVSAIKANATKANDELKIFLASYNDAKKDTNLSAMDDTYNAIIASFNEQRFEDTLTLIDKGYTQISDIQSSQTSLKLFYETTSRSIKQFIQDNWKTISITLAIIIIILAISCTSIRRFRVRSKINHLTLQKATLNELIKKMQTEYFKSKKISETEYQVKTKRFKEMIRDVDRQIPLLKEKLFKLEKKK